MNTSSPTRLGLIATISAIHIALIWWLSMGMHTQKLTLPTPLPAMMVELLTPPQPVARPEPPKPQPVVQPKPQKAPPKKVAPPKPVVKDTPAPLPTPEPVAAPTPTPAPAAPPVAAAPPAPPAPPAPAPVSPPRFNVAYLKNPLPPYPGMLRRAGQEGKVLLRVFVTADGRAGEVKLEKSSGFPQFDESAATTVKDWKFQPGKRGDTPEAQWVMVPINFTLN